jgi:beta-N-acetylhexosaminidase
VLVCAVEGTTLTPEERAFYRDVQPAGLTLFTRNVPTPYGGLRSLVGELQALRASNAPPLVIAIDQEGGRVARIKPVHAGGGAIFPERGPALKLEDGRDDRAALQAIQAYGADLGAALARLGVNVDFAPCCDVLTRADNHAIGDRAFATTAEAAAARAQAFLRGLQGAGVLGSLKHFPGQGDAGVDTHLGSAVIDRSLAELEERELVPFRRLLPDAAMVMVAHCIYPQLAKEEASRSPWIIGELLRKRLGFDGVVVSDDMNMGAIPQEGGVWEDALLAAVAAGADMLLVCRHLERFQRAHAALVREAARSPAFAERLEDAAARVTALRRQLPV